MSDLRSLYQEVILDHKKGHEIFALWRVLIFGLMGIILYAGIR